LMTSSQKSMLPKFDAIDRNASHESHSSILFRSKQVLKFNDTSVATSQFPLTIRNKPRRILVPDEKVGHHLVTLSLDRYVFTLNWKELYAFGKIMKT
jgi:hypothetical protein